MSEQYTCEKCTVGGQKDTIASWESENDTDKRLQQVLDSEDQDIVVDLRHHNKGHTSKYDIRSSGTHVSDISRAVLRQRTT